MTGFWIAIAGGVLGAFFSALHMSLRTASRARLRDLSGNDTARLRSIEIILDDIWSHSLGVSLLRVVANIALVIGLLAWLTGVGEGSTVEWPSLLIASAVSAVAIYLFSVVAPTSVADHMGEALVVRCAPLIRFVHFALLPLHRSVRFFDVVIRQLAGAQPHDATEEIEREILSVVSEGESEGSLNEAERDMIEAVVDLRTKVVSEIMTPRTEMEGFDCTDDLSYIRTFIEKAGHSRIPVYDGDTDHIAGLLYAKDLLQYLGESTDQFELRPILRDAWFVPETKPIIELLQDFQREEMHIAIVLDEYGGTAGLVTIEDVVEEIVGEIRDEYEPVDEQEPEITVFADQNAVEIDARANIDDVNDCLEDELDEPSARLPEGEEYDTVGGFVMSALGHIPTAGEEFRCNGFLVRILESEPTRVRRVRIEFDAPEPENEPPAADAQSGVAK